MKGRILASLGIISILCYIFIMWNESIFQLLGFPVLIVLPNYVSIVMAIVLSCIVSPSTLSLIGDNHLINLVKHITFSLIICFPTTSLFGVLFNYSPNLSSKIILISLIQMSFCILSAILVKWIWYKTLTKINRNKTLENVITL